MVLGGGGGKFSHNTHNLCNHNFDNLSYLYLAIHTDIIVYASLPYLVDTLSLKQLRLDYMGF